jgi:hypothetical protein
MQAAFSACRQRDRQINAPPKRGTDRPRERERKAPPR